MERAHEITNSMLYELLRDFKQDFRNFKEEMYSFKKETNKRFEKIEARQEEDHQMLMDLWENRKEIQIKFSRSVIVALMLMAGTISLIISLAINTI